MSAADGFPRVLFVTPCAFNHVTGGGVTFSNLFRGWPKDRLATAHGDSVPVSTDVCSRYFRFTPDELRPAGPFSLLKRNRSAAMDAGPSAAVQKSGALKSFASKWIGAAGLPDHGILSPALETWIREFSPDVIYTILGTIGYADLVEAIRKRFDLPVVVHFMDEGVTDPKGGGIFSSWIRPRYEKLVRSLVSVSKARIGICGKMSDAYGARFGLPFDTFMNTVDMDKHPSRTEKPREDGFHLVYTGAVLPYSQEESLRDCCRAVSSLYRKGNKVRLDIYTALGLFGRNLAGMADPECVFIHDAIPEDARYFQTLRDADAVLLPVNFDPHSVHYIRYSMPTKVPSYLCSGTPILAYGPLEVAQIEYAQNEHWASVVAQRDPELLQNAILEILKNSSLRNALSIAALETARRNHDSAHERKRFEGLLAKAASRG